MSASDDGLVVVALRMRRVLIGCAGRPIGWVWDVPRTGP